MPKPTSKLAREISDLARTWGRPHEVFDALVEMLFLLTIITHYPPCDPHTRAVEDLDRLMGKIRDRRVDYVAFMRLTEALLERLWSGYDDVLGDLAAELGALDKGAAQYFTPSCLSQLCAQLVAPDPSAPLPACGYLTLHEPAVGSGAMVLRFAERLRTAGHDPKTTMFVEAWDISPYAWRMAFVQLSMRDIPARVVLGDTLTMRPQRMLYTPVYFAFFEPARSRREAAAA